MHIFNFHNVVKLSVKTRQRKFRNFHQLTLKDTDDKISSFDLR